VDGARADDEAGEESARRRPAPTHAPEIDIIAVGERGGAPRGAAEIPVDFDAFSLEQGADCFRVAQR
jgi:hypothetical protein